MSDHAASPEVEPDIGLEAKVAFLRRPGAYSDAPAAVAAAETHMSWVFLVDSYAYKLKKPVRTGFLDFATIAARRLNCEREVALNRRLAEDVYIGIVPLTVDQQGRLRLGGDGRVVDWLVKMRRLPAERTLERAIADGTVREADIRRLSVRLVKFFRAAEPVPFGPAEYIERLRREVSFYEVELCRPAYGLSTGPVKELAAAQRNFLARHGDTVGSRGARVIDGHGDLRPEHVYLGDGLEVLDCIEFNRELRLLDPVDELSYLSMECRRLGSPAAGAWLIDAYKQASGDDPSEALVAFYHCLRAYLRATVAIWHLNEPAAREGPKWSARAGDYLHLAQDYAERFS